MINNIWKRCLGITIIFLFIGVAVAPSINLNVVEAFDDNNCIEVTMQVCSIDGIRNHTVQLTRQQYQNLQQSFAEFKERVYQTTSREEVNEVFNEFIIELHNYGLLGRLSIKQAQYLVTGLISQYSIHGEAKENTYFLGPIARIPAKIVSYLRSGLGAISMLTIILAIFMIPLCLRFATDITEKQILSNIFYGYTFYDPYTHYYLHPAHGSVWTSGPEGNKSWNGTFYGTIFSRISYLTIGFMYMTEFHLGVIGFTGLRVYSNSTNVYFGSARKVGISSVY